MFISTFEKQLDAKRRIVVPMEFRAVVSGPFDGVYCYPSIDEDCIEGGGRPLVDRYRAVAEALPFKDPERTRLERAVLGRMTPMNFDTAGRITLPEWMCERFGLTDWVSVVGLGDYFQIWPRDVFNAQWEDDRRVAREAIQSYGEAERRRRAVGASE